MNKKTGFWSWLLALPKNVQADYLKEVTVKEYWRPINIKEVSENQLDLIEHIRGEIEDIIIRAMMERHTNFDEIHLWMLLNPERLSKEDQKDIDCKLAEIEKILKDKASYVLQPINNNHQEEIGTEDFYQT